MNFQIRARKSFLLIILLVIVLLLLRALTIKDRRCHTKRTPSRRRWDSSFTVNVERRYLGPTGISITSSLSHRVYILVARQERCTPMKMMFFGSIIGSSLSYYDERYPIVRPYLEFLYSNVYLGVSLYLII